MRRLLGAIGIVAAITVAASACGSAPTVPGLVIGGVEPCSAVGPPPGGEPHYAAATVTVLEGDVQITGNYAYLPTKEVTRQQVGQDQLFRFVLAPGDYVLVANYASGAEVHPRIGVALKSGELIRTDIPNMCI